jgi:hypothetical protein
MNVDHAIHLLNKRADERLAAAAKTPPGQREFVKYCRTEARFFDAIAECIEQLQKEVIEERKKRELTKEEADRAPRPMPPILKGMR